MPSSFSPSLRIELQATGENADAWGDVANKNFGLLLEQAVAGYVTLPLADADLVLTTAQGEVDQARGAILNVTGTLTAARTVIAPPVSKVYVVRNSTAGGHDVLIKTALGTAVAVPADSAYVVFCDGLHFYAASSSGGGSGGSGSSKVELNDVALGTQYGASGYFVRTPLLNLCRRGMLSKIVVVSDCTGGAPLYDLELRAGAGATAPLLLGASAIQRTRWEAYLPVYVESDPGDNIHVGVRSWQGGTTTFKLQYLRLEKFA